MGNYISNNNRNTGVQEMQQLENLIENCKIQYSQCDISELHLGEQNNYLCLEKKCLQQNPICSLCKEEKHQKHNVIPIKFFIHKLRKSQSQLQSQEEINENKMQDQKTFNSKYNFIGKYIGISKNFGKKEESVQEQEKKINIFQNQQEEILEGEESDYYINKMQDSQQSTLFLLKELVMMISQKIKFLEQTLVDNYRYSKESLINSEKMNQYAESIFSFHLGEQQAADQNGQKQQNRIIREQYQKLFQNLNFFDNGQVKIQSQKQICESFIKNNEQMQNKLRNVQLESSKLFQKLRQQNLQDSQNKDGLYHFLNDHKPNSIQISKQMDVITQTQNQNEYNRFVFLNQDFSQNQNMRIQLTILKCNNFIAIGACDKRYLKSINYKFDYNSLNHGCYMLSSNNYLWYSGKNGKNKTKVNKFGSKFLKQHDNVILQFDATKKIFSIINGNRFEFDFNNGNINLEDLCVCVNLGGKGDSVQLVKY